MLCFCQFVFDVVKFDMDGQLFVVVGFVVVGWFFQDCFGVIGCQVVVFCVGKDVDCVVGQFLQGGVGGLCFGISNFWFYCVLLGSYCYLVVGEFGFMVDCVVGQFVIDIIFGE